jgi:hypothetical protein
VANVAAIGAQFLGVGQQFDALCGSGRSQAELANLTSIVAANRPKNAGFKRDLPIQHALLCLSQAIRPERSVVQEQDHFRTGGAAPDSNEVFEGQFQLS